jgi:alkaline phosphatase D
MAYDQVLISPVQALLYRFVPLVYMWDDHDFAGNNSDHRAASRAAARYVYEEYVPHYDTPAGQRNVPIYQSFSVGRTKFVLTDLRSERDEVSKPDGPNKSMLGAAQKAWFKRELLAAKGRYPLIFWVSTVPWIGNAGVNYYPINGGVTGFIHQTNTALFKRNPATAEDNRNVWNNDDFWGAFTYERREIADFIRDNHITGVCILHGDAHMLAADDGRHSDYSTGGGVRFPVMAAAPLDQDSSIKGGPYSQGVYKARNGEGCFGYVQVRDSGAKIEVNFSGRNYMNEEKVALRFSVPGN